MPVNLNKIPNTPGVYKFFNNQEIIYIGKAKNLKKRVSTYFGNSLKDRKTLQIKLLTNKVETFTTKNEVEALLLEQLLIKENKPKFNILLRDDKTYPYIFFSLEHDFPGIYLKRTKKSVDKNYFGPFISSEAVKKSIKEIQKIYKLRNCTDNTFSNRTRPCIEYQMKRCSGPCVGKVNKVDYFEDVTEAKNFLSTSDKKTLKILYADIEDAISNLNFEKAAIIRDKIARLNLIREEQSVVTLADNVDIFSVQSEMNYLGVSIIVVRKGKIRGTKTHLVKKAYYTSIDDIYHSVIFNFYDHQLDIPKKILCANPIDDKKILEDMFQTKHGKKVKIIQTPSKSIKPIFNLCKLNSKQVIKNHISKEEKYTFAFDELSKYLGLKEINRVEGFDVSHISGDNAVASCVVFSKRGPLKNKYRLFNIPKNLSGNDVGSLEHVMNRRIKYFEEPNNKPDLILVDGGEVQLKYVDSVLNKSKHKDLNTISIVKGSNRVRATETIISKKGVIEFDKYSKAFLLLQEIRDESHRFAIHFMRQKKKRRITKSKLDNVRGVGSILKIRILKKFKSIKIIKSLSEEDLMTVKGISAKIAKTILKELK